MGAMESIAGILVGRERDQEVLSEFVTAVFEG